MDLTDQVIERAETLGGDLVGIAPVERFKGAPLRMSPQGLLPEAKAVVVVAIHHLDASVELGGEPTPHDMGPYGSQSRVMNPKLDDISFLLARLLEEKGYKTLPIAASNIWRYKGYKDLKVDFAPDIAHRYAAVAAGLGEIGWSGLVLTPQFGPRQRFVSVITEADLRPSPMYEGEPLCDRCMACVEKCPTDAFRKEVKRINEVEIGGRTFEFPDTNKWRCAWAENFGLSLAHDIPEKVDQGVILQYLEKYGTRGGEEGCCLKFCMVPERRYCDASYCRGPRRRKEKAAAGPDELLEQISEIVAARGVDLVGIGQQENLAGDPALHPEYHLPDVCSVVCLGVQAPQGGEGNGALESALGRLLDYAAFEVAHHLDISGYSAVTGTRIADASVARRLGIYAPDARFTTVLTSARLPSTVRKRKQEPGRLVPAEMRRFCKEAGADLVGFFTVERFEEFRRSLQGLGLLPQAREVVQDRSGALYGPYVPEVRQEEIALRGPADWLSGARAVIVIGLHFPDSALDTAKATPAETTGPFAFVQYETLNLLGDVAFRVVRRLNDSGFRATFTFDLTGLASKVRNSRGMLPDMRANVFAAILAGLAYPGVHGHPLTSEYGTRQRFVAVVTDCPLPDDPLYAGEVACESCSKPCIEACPTGAILDEKVMLRLAGREFALHKIDCFACDWAKRYGLSGREGPAYWGLSVDVALPQERTAEALAGALAKVDWGVQKRHLNIAEECLRVCPARGKRAG